MQSAWAASDNQQTSWASQVDKKDNVSEAVMQTKSQRDTNAQILNMATSIKQ